MITVTARKHLIAALRSTLLISHNAATSILNRNSFCIDTFIGGKGQSMKNAFVAVVDAYESRDTARLHVYVDGQFKVDLTCTKEHLDAWHQLPMEEAYKPIPGKAQFEAKNRIESFVGKLEAVRDHPAVPGVLLLDVKSDDGADMTFQMLPSALHDHPSQLRRYVMQYYQVRRTFHVCGVWHNSSCLEGVPEGIDHEMQSVEFIMEAPYSLYGEDHLPLAA